MYVVQTGPDRYFQRRGCILCGDSKVPGLYETREEAQKEVQVLHVLKTFLVKTGKNPGTWDRPVIIKWESNADAR